MVALERVASYIDECSRKDPWGPPSITPAIRESFFKEAEVEVEKIEGVTPLEEGDLLATYFGREWILGVVVGFVGRRAVLYTGNNGQGSYRLLNQSKYRLARGLEISRPPLPFLKSEIPEDPRGKYLISATHNNDLCAVVTESYSKVLGKIYPLIAIEDPCEICFDDPEKLILSADYLIHGENGLPIIISDFHQKFAVHIAELISLNLLPNIVPDVDWIDEHYDDCDQYVPQGSAGLITSCHPTFEDIVGACSRSLGHSPRAEFSRWRLATMAATARVKSFGDGVFSLSHLATFSPTDIGPCSTVINLTSLNII